MGSWNPQTENPAKMGIQWVGCPEAAVIPTVNGLYVVAA